jgi:hypothetical protein
LNFNSMSGKALRGNPYTAAGLWQPGDVRACARFSGVRRRDMGKRHV